MKLDEGRLPEHRLVLIEQSARERSTLADKVTLELVAEIRRLRELLAAGDEEALGGHEG